MSRLRVHSFAISLDGYGAGPNQDLNNPLGVGGMALHEWMFGDTYISTDGWQLGRCYGHRRRLRRTSRIAGRGSSAETCSGRSENRGPMTLGKDGGARIRRTTLPYSSSRITRAHRSK